jgi:hypothetical protein
MMFVPDDKSAEVLKPRKEAFDLPSPLVATQRTTILGDRLASPASVRSNHLHRSFFGEASVQWITVIGFVTNETRGKFIQKTRVQCGVNESHFMRASTGCANGERKTASVCKAHNLGSFAPFGLAHTIAPFFAGAKVPSMKPSLRSIPPRSRRSSARAVRILAKTPDSVHSWKRRWQVLLGGYRDGRSAHGAPVRRIQRMPSSTARKSWGGRPEVPGCALGFGRYPAIRCHCSFVRSIDHISGRNHVSIEVLG